MKKIVVSKLFLYKYRFVIGYVILGVAFLSLLFSLPLIAQTGVSEAEMDSAVRSYALGYESPVNGDLVDLPYRLLQKLSIMWFGLTPYAIKLPSIIMGLLLGVLLILLLNRWFKNNVSLLASCLVILSTPFLFLAGNGTPLIMIVFWPTLLLWLGSKIQGEKRPKPSYCFLFAIALLAAIFTPYMTYFALFSVAFVLAQPHLRFVVKSLPRAPLVLMLLFVLAGISLLTLNAINQPETILELLFAKNYDANQFLSNLGSGLGLVFSWHDTLPSVFLTPLMGIPTFALALIGLFSTTKGFFASRNSIASLLIVFTLIITGFRSSAVVFFILPFTILMAHGIKYLLEKWYGLFPKNPYARVAGFLPLGALFAIMIIPSLLQYIHGYQYNPVVANEFSYDLEVIYANLHDETLMVSEHYDFYRLLELKSNIKVVDRTDETNEISGNVAVLHGSADLGPKYRLDRIITSKMREKSDIIYLYTEKGE